MRTEPPFTFNDIPVIYEASSEARKRTAAAQSSGFHILLSGIVSAITESLPPRKTSAVISVYVQPGQTEFTLIPLGPNSEASDLVKEFIAPLLAA